MPSKMHAKRRRSLRKIRLKKTARHAPATRRQPSAARTHPPFARLLPARRPHAGIHPQQAAHRAPTAHRPTARHANPYASRHSPTQRTETVICRKLPAVHPQHAAIVRPSDHRSCTTLRVLMCRPRGDDAARAYVEHAAGDRSEGLAEKSIARSIRAAEASWVYPKGQLHRSASTRGLEESHNSCIPILARSRPGLVRPMLARVEPNSATSCRIRAKFRRSCRNCSKVGRVRAGPPIRPCCTHRTV